MVVDDPGERPSPWSLERQAVVHGEPGVTRSPQAEGRPRYSPTRRAVDLSMAAGRGVEMVETKRKSLQISSHCCQDEPEKNR